MKIKMKSKTRCTTLGKPQTVGQLRAMLEAYADGVEFGFRNQPMQELQSVTWFERGNIKLAVVFQ